MIYKPLWGHGQCPTKSPSTYYTGVITMLHLLQKTAHFSHKHNQSWFGKPFFETYLLVVFNRKLIMLHNIAGIKVLST